MSSASESGERSATRVISRTTPITLGLFIAGIGGVVSSVGFLIGAIWWAATLQTKLDMVIDDFKSLSKERAEAVQKLSDLEHRITVLENRKP